MSKNNMFRKIIRELFLKFRCVPRYDLERKIMPKIKNKKVLLVGVADYVSDYPKRLSENELHSIDIDPSVARFGSKKHITGSVVEIDKYFPENSFDVILFCGVFGCGLDAIEDAEKALQNCHKVLKEGGILIVGWDTKSVEDKGYRTPLSESLENYKLFVPVSMFGFPVGYKFDSKDSYHTYDFLKK